MCRAMVEARPKKDAHGSTSTYSSASSAHDSPPPAPFPVRILPLPARYQLAFPNALEKFFQPLDDAIIALFQRNTDGLVHAFSMALTFFTSIEFSLAAPSTLYALGYDSAAGLATSMLFVLGVVSQIPKKFIFRLRPWMVGRALPIRQDMTSSFPSRAVVCATVFSWLTAQALHAEGFLGDLSPFRLWLGILLVAGLAAFARINVGAHYPSDTILGFALGCIIIRIGARFEQLWQSWGCRLDSVYPTASQSLLDNAVSTLRNASWQNLAVVTFLSYLLTLVSIQGFWVKCSYVYGLLLSSAAFRAAFLGCGSIPACVAKVEDHGSLWDHVQATVLFASLLVMGMISRGEKDLIFRVLTFSVIYHWTILAVLYWRLQPQVLYS